MNSKLPDLFVNKHSEKTINNQKNFYSKNDIYTLDESKKVNNMVILKKINDIFSSTKFVYKVNCFIKTLDEEKQVSLIAKTNKHLLTINNELIPIESIIKIEEI